MKFLTIAGAALLLAGCVSSGTARKQASLAQLAASLSKGPPHDWGGHGGRHNQMC
jgi:Spy/CpxP family protein refolding chaperone